MKVNLVSIGIVVGISAVVSYVMVAWVLPVQMKTA